MIVVAPLLWLIAWLAIAGVVAAFSGLAPQGAGLMLFLIVFLGGGFGLPLLGGLAWFARSRWQARKD